MNKESPKWTVNVPGWLAESGVSSRAFHLYVFLAGKYSSPKRFPSRKRLATDLGCSDDTIDRLLKELVDIGAVIKKRRVGKDGALNTNSYTVIPSKGEDK